MVILSVALTVNGVCVCVREVCVCMCMHNKSKRRKKSGTQSLSIQGQFPQFGSPSSVFSPTPTRVHKLIDLKEQTLL